MIRRHRLEAFWAVVLLAVVFSAGPLMAKGPVIDPPVTPVALAVSVPEVVQGKGVPAVSVASDIAGQKSVSMTLASAQWTTKPGVSVTARMEQSVDGGATWTLLMGFTAISGPVPNCPSGPPCSALPSMSFAHSKLADTRKVRITITPSDVISLGAAAVSSDKDPGGK